MKPEFPNIRSRENPSGDKVYFLDYKDPLTGKRIRETTGTRERDAQKRARHVHNENIARWQGEEDLRAEELTISDLVETYFRAKQGRTKDRTITRYRIHATHFLDFMKANYSSIKYIRQIKSAYIIDHLDKLRSAGQAPKTLNAQLRFLKGLFIFAVKEKYLASNPAMNIGRYAEPQQSESVKFWTREEFKSILDACKPYYRDAYEFLFLTGLRKEELMFLTWNDVNVGGAEPHIQIQTKEISPGEYWTPKAKQLRVIPLNGRAVELINKQTHSEKNNWVFKAPNGGQVHPDRLLQVLKDAAHKVGLEGNVHKIRHSFASQLVMSGVGIETVSKLLGHSSIEMTMKYAHLAPDHLRAAIEKLRL